ncbi:MAG: superoxide dismutase family protein [Calditrichaeota bacterium]|nr:MAG: superoxide dismutase family protein [Calditrichota bacterium]
MMRKLSTFLLSALVVTALSSCKQQKTEEKPAETKAARTAIAQMNPTEGNEAHGTVTFTEVENGIQVKAHLEGVPEGDHGFHIHENGDCADNGKAAGGHWNPEGKPHGARDAAERHVGDLGNVTADANGVVDTTFVDSVITFDGPNSIIGKGVILHEKADDLTSQPTGAAGARIACGVIEWSKE